MCVLSVYMIQNYCKCFHFWVNSLSSLSSLPLRLPSVPHRWRMRHLPFFLSSLPPRSATSLKDATSSVLPAFIATQECHITEGRDIFRSSKIYFQEFWNDLCEFWYESVFVLLSCLHNSSSFLQEFNCKHFKIRSCSERYMSGSLCNYCILLYCKSLPLRKFNFKIRFFFVHQRLDACISLCILLHT